MRVPEIHLSPLPDGPGWAVYRGSMRLGSLFPVDAGWVTRTAAGRRSKPFAAAADAAARWGADARAAVVSRETSEAA